MRDAQVGLPARRAAAELLSAVLQKKQALDDMLGRSLDKGFMFDLPARDRALTRAIVATSLRRKGQLDHVLGSFLERGLPERSGTLYPILLSAAAQLIFLKTPPHAAIDLAVTLVQYDPKAKRYDKLANAVLRRVASEGEAIAAALDAARINTPDWLWSRWVAYWGETRARAIAEAHLIEPPLDLTVKSEPELWAERLSGRVLPTGSVRFLPKGRIDALPGFDDGAWWVQDVAASLPARLLGDVAGKRVADLCAAPGGKTAQLVLAGGVGGRGRHLEDAARAARRESRAARARGRHGAGRCGGVAARGALRCGAARRAVLLDRHHPPASRHPLYQSRRRTSSRSPRSRPGCWTTPPRWSSPAAGWSIRPARSSPRKARRRSRHFWCGTTISASTPSIRASFSAKRAGSSRQAALRTFPYDLTLETPEWSGMDGFFATRLVRSD